MDQGKQREKIEEFINIGTKKWMPQLSIDCVIFSFHESRLKVLLLKPFYIDLMVLPSGFIFNDEDIDEAALRNLKDRTSLDQIFLQQFHAFGKASRFFPNQLQELITNLGIDREKMDWLFRRFVTIGYYALVDYNRVKPRPDVFTEKCIWADIEELPPLIMDHTELIQKAMYTLKKDLQVQPIGLQLLPDSFTLPELQSLYETILNRPIDRRNFRKKMLQSNILEALDEQRITKGHRSPKVYRFDREQYEESLQEEIKIGF